MANIKISQLTAAAAALGTQEFEVNESLTSKKVTGAQILSYIHANTTADDVGALESADIGVSVQGYDADTAKTDVAQSFAAAQRGTVSGLTDGATITPNFQTSCNFTVTLGGNRTMANPSAMTVGQSGSIFIVQDGTGSRTLSWGSYWDFIQGSAPVLTTTASAIDRVDYVVRSATSIHTVLTSNYS